MKIIDLSHPYEVGMTQFPGTPPIDIKQISDVEKDGFRVTDVHSIVHVGTHCDAPAHYIVGGKTMDKIPLESFIGDAVIVDVKLKGNIIGPEVLEDHDISPGDIVLLRTGFCKYWGMPEYVDKAPHLSNELAKRLVDLEIKALGLDFLSPDPVDGNTTHHILLGAEIPLIENLKNLDKIDAERVFFSAAPILVKGSDGGFTRAYAIVKE